MPIQRRTKQIQKAALRPTYRAIGICCRNSQLFGVSGGTGMILKKRAVAARIASLTDLIRSGRQLSRLLS
jgi:hypothetical protein